jgi:hypothetical protein
VVKVKERVEVSCGEFTAEAAFRLATARTAAKIMNPTTGELTRK